MKRTRYSVVTRSIVFVLDVPTNEFLRTERERRLIADMVDIANHNNVTIHFEEIEE